VGWRWWGLSEPLVKDKDLRGFVCGGVSVSLSGFWVGDVVALVGFISMALFGIKGWNFGDQGFVKLRGFFGKSKMDVKGE
jgi:hypothetical protein